jgi:hypothetical protein
MKKANEINLLCGRCIEDGKAVLTTKWTNHGSGSFVIMNPTTYVDLQLFSKWKADCLLLLNFLGNSGKPWKALIKEDSINTDANAISIMGAIESIKSAIDNGLINEIEEIINAETFSNLLEQAEYLFDQDYFIASAILCRAVIEEKLKEKCELTQSEITREKPTVNDYSMSLYKSQIIDKVMMKNIEYLASIGNNAAHNLPVAKNDVQSLISGTKEILLRV